MGIHKKLRRGQLFQFPKTAKPASNGVRSEGCVEYTIDDSSKQGFFGTTERLSAPGSNAGKNHRNYIWIPWMPEAVNYTEQQGKDVMSGPFSGCYMIRYRIAGGGWRVAHVHTPGAIDAWNTHANTNGFEIGSGFKPYLRRESESNHDKTYGIITDDGNCYRVWAGEYQYGHQDPTIGLRSIKEIVKIDSLPPNDLKNLTPM